MGGTASKDMSEDDHEEEVSTVYDDIGHSNYLASTSGMNHTLRSQESYNVGEGDSKNKDEMQKLITYLKNVANNSDNLPKTFRDDPDLGRIVSTITPEEYETKAAAFLPADIRIIGGVFMKYHKVWDLPTCEEFVLSDGAQEPGLSYGGACTNALLKVVYDGASEAAKAMQINGSSSNSMMNFINPNNLFDDEEDDDEDDQNENDSPNFVQPDLVKSFTNVSALSWAEIIKRMKVVMSDEEFVQYPIITSSRRIDLEKTFDIVPEGFDRAKNKKRALLIGINYSDSFESKLTTSHDDVISVKEFLCNCHGFPDDEEHMNILLDDGKCTPPTYTNILEAFKKLALSCEPGDAVWISFSGHGCRILDLPVNAEVEGYDEIIVPSDFKEGEKNNNVIRDTLIFSTLLSKIPKGVTVTCVFDACDKGFVLDLPYSWSTGSRLGQTDVAKVSKNLNLDQELIRLCDSLFVFIRFLIFVIHR